MAALELLCHFMGIDSKKLSKEEIIILEAELYTRISNEILESYMVQHKSYFRLMKFNVEMEDIIMELQVTRCLINDILKSNAYTLSGIAYYTQTPEEIIQDLIVGYKVGPMLALNRKLIELHKLIRPDIYKNIIKKIISDEQDGKENGKEK